MNITPQTQQVSASPGHATVPEGQSAMVPSNQPINVVVSHSEGTAPPGSGTSAAGATQVYIISSGGVGMYHNG